MSHGVITTLNNTTMFTLINYNKPPVKESFNNKSYLG